MQYHCLFIDKNKQRIEKTFDFKDKESLTSFLISKGYVILEINEKKSFLNIELSSSISKREIVSLTSQISFLLHANINLLDTLRILKEDQKPALKEVLTEIVNDIAEGMPVYKAFQRHNKYFPALYINLVKVGEETASLGNVFSKLADFLEKNDKIISKAKKALVYPCFILIVMMVVVSLMLVVVVPNITEIIVSSGGEIPISTQIIIGSSNFFINFGGPILLFLIAFFAVFFFMLKKDARLRTQFDYFKVSNKFISNLFVYYNLALYFKSLYLMTSSSLTISHSISESIKSINNFYLKDIFSEIEKDINNGNSVSYSFSRQTTIPLIAKSFITAGENSGGLTKSFEILSNYFENKFNDAVDSIIKLIEPILIVFLAFVVGGILIGVLTPIYSITTQIS